MKAFTSENIKEHRKAGVATLLNKRVALLVKDKMVLRDEEGRFLAIPIRTLEKGVHLWVLNIYAPASTKDKKRFWEVEMVKQMQRVKMRSSTRDRIVVGMDANLTWAPKVDKEWGTKSPEEMAKVLQQKEKASTWLREWAEESDMVDTWRMKHPTDREYTWGHKQKQAQAIRKRTHSEATAAATAGHGRGSTRNGMHYKTRQRRTHHR